VDSLWKVLQHSIQGQEVEGIEGQIYWRRPFQNSRYLDQLGQQGYGIRNQTQLINGQENRLSQVLQEGLRLRREVTRHHLSTGCQNALLDWSHRKEAAQGLEDIGEVRQVGRVNTQTVEQNVRTIVR